MPTWLHCILSVALTPIAILVVAILVKVVVNTLPKMMYGDSLNITSIFLTLVSLCTGIFFFCNETQIWASVSFLLFATLLSQFIPFFAHTFMFAGKGLAEEHYRNFQFIVWVSSGVYFSYTTLGLLQGGAVRDVETFLTTARIFALVILAIWVFLVFDMRRHCRSQGGLAWVIMFQHTILPFIVGISLLISGNFLVLMFGLIAWILSIFFTRFFMFIFPLVVGWNLGRDLSSYWEPLPTFWHYAAGPIGLVVMFIVCTIVTAIVVTHSRGNSGIQQRREIF